MGLSNRKQESATVLPVCFAETKTQNSHSFNQDTKCTPDHPGLLLLDCYGAFTWCFHHWASLHQPTVSSLQQGCSSTQDRFPQPNPHQESSIKSMVLNRCCCIGFRFRHASIAFVPVRAPTRPTTVHSRIPTLPNRLTVRLINQPQVHAVWGHKQLTLSNGSLWKPQGSVRVRVVCLSITLSHIHYGSGALIEPWRGNRPQCGPLHHALLNSQSGKKTRLTTPQNIQSGSPASHQVLYPSFDCSIKAGLMTMGV